MAHTEPVMVIEHVARLGGLGLARHDAARPVTLFLTWLQVIDVVLPLLFPLFWRADADIAEFRLVFKLSAHEVDYASERLSFKD